MGIFSFGTTAAPVTTVAEAIAPLLAVKENLLAVMSYAAERIALATTRIDAARIELERVEQEETAAATAATDEAHKAEGIVNALSVLLGTPPTS